MSRRRTIIALVALVSGFAFSAFSQGTFQNLDFERARIAPTPTNEYGGGVDPALAFPGWSLSKIGSGYPLFVLYNNLTLDAPAIDLIGPSFPNALGVESLQGSYSVVLQYSSFFNISPVLSQTGMVPPDAKSINLAFTVLPWELAFNGVNIPLIPVSGGRAIGDISSFAGMVAEMRFSGGGYFDDIQFSNQPIPEPSVILLSALGGLFLFRRLARKHLT